MKRNASDRFYIYRAGEEMGNAKTALIKARDYLEEGKAKTAAKRLENLIERLEKLEHKI